MPVDYSAAAELVPAHYLARETCKGEGRVSWVKGSHCCRSVHGEEHAVDAGEHGLVISGYVTFFDHVISGADHVISGDSLAGCAAAVGCDHVPEAHVTSHDYHVTSGCDSVPASNPRASGAVHPLE